MNKTQERLAAARALKADPLNHWLQQALRRECRLPKGGYRTPDGARLGNWLSAIALWVAHVDDAPPTQWWEVKRHGSNATNQHMTQTMIVNMVRAHTATHARWVARNAPDLTVYDGQHLTARQVQHWAAEEWLGNQAEILKQEPYRDMCPDCCVDPALMGCICDAEHDVGALDELRLVGP